MSSEVQPVLKKFKRFIVLCGLSFLILHFSATLVYVEPGKYFPPFVISAIRAYMLPIFYQNWVVFAPEPTINSNKFWYRCKTKNQQWSVWIDPGEELLQKHYANRFLYYGKLHEMYDHLVRRLYSTYEYLNVKYKDIPDNEKKKVIDKEIINTPIYQIAQKYTLILVGKHFPRNDIEEIEFKCVFIAPPNFSERHNVNAEIKYKYLEFPAFYIDND